MWYRPFVHDSNESLNALLQTSRAVVNASHRRLSDVEVEALALGERFIPHPPPPLPPPPPPPPTPAPPQQEQQQQQQQQHLSTGTATVSSSNRITIKKKKNQKEKNRNGAGANAAYAAAAKSAARQRRLGAKLPAAIAAFVDRVNAVAGYHDPRPRVLELPRKEFNNNNTSSIDNNNTTTNTGTTTTTTSTALFDGLPAEYFFGPQKPHHRRQKNRRAWSDDPSVARILRQAAANLSRHNPCAASKPEKTSLSTKTTTTSRQQQQQQHQIRSSSSSSRDQSVLTNALAWLADTEQSGVVVRSADKGGSMVVWCLEAYVRCGLDHLLGDPANTEGKEEEEEMYRMLPGGLDEATAMHDAARRELAALCEAMTRERCLKPGGVNYIRTLTSDLASPIRFHPKLHKPPCESSMTFAGRPIVSTVRSVTRGLDQYLSVLTRELVSRIPFTLTSSKELAWRLRRLNDHCHESGLQLTGLHTADVVGLYPSVRWEAGVAACVETYRRWRPWLEHRLTNTTKYRESGLRPPSVSLFEKMLRFVLSNNIIHFAEARMYFIQTSGIAMGSCVSAYVAGCYMWSCMSPVVTTIHSNHPLHWPSYDPDNPRHYLQQHNEDVKRNKEEEEEEKKKTQEPPNEHEKEEEQPTTATTRIVFIARYVDDFLCATARPLPDPRQQQQLRELTLAERYREKITQEEQGRILFENFVAGMRKNSPDSNSLSFKYT